MGVFDSLLQGLGGQGGSGGGAQRQQALLQMLGQGGAEGLGDVFLTCPR
jgi:hypothetical protein